MRSPPKMPQRAMVRIWVASLHQKDQRRKYAGFCFIRYLKFHSRGWIRTAAEPTAARGRNREARLGQRSAFSKSCQGAAEKAASATRKTRRTVRQAKNPLRGFFRCAARDIHPRPPKRQTDTQKQTACRPESVSAYKSPHPAAAAADRVRAFFV